MNTMSFASPWPPSIPLPGSAWPWVPSRPFPVHLWLAKRASATPPAGTTCGAAAKAPARSAGFQPARPGGAPRTPSSPEASAHPLNLAEKLAALFGLPPLPTARPPVPLASAPTSSQPAQNGSTAQPSGAAFSRQPPDARLDLELRLLFSCAPAPLDEAQLAALHHELDQRAWSLAHTSGAPRPADPAWPTVPHPENALEKRRARLVADVDLGLSMVELSATRFSRPVRNVMLARQAKYIGRGLRDLLADPEAGSFAAEFEGLLEGLRRRR
jgi:hypothetical protein